MGLLGLLILILILWMVGRNLLYRTEVEAEREARDRADPYAPPAAPLEEEPAPPRDPEGDAFAGRVKGALEGISEALPLGAQPGWNFGPPPPPAELEPPEDEHHRSVAPDELAGREPKG